MYPPMCNHRKRKSKKETSTVSGHICNPIDRKHRAPSVAMLASSPFAQSPTFDSIHSILAIE